MNFGEVLSRAWEIIWKYKILWIFGILAALAGSGGGSNSGLRFDQSNFNWDGSGRFFDNPPAWLIFLAVMAALLLMVVVVVVSAYGRAGLIRGAWLADSEGVVLGEAGSDMTFSRISREGQAYFGRVLLLNILVFLLGFLIILVLAVPTVLTAALTFGIGLICLLPLLCLLVPFFMLLSVLIDLSVIAIVGEDRSIPDGLQRGWQVFRDNLAQVVVLALILIILSAVIGFFIGLPMMMIVLPFVPLMINQSQGYLATGIILAVLLFLLYLPVLLTARGILQSYLDTAWTVAFRRMTGRGPGVDSSLLVEAPIDPVI